MSTYTVSLYVKKITRRKGFHLINVCYNRNRKITALPCFECFPLLKLVHVMEQEENLNKTRVDYSQVNKPNQQGLKLFCSAATLVYFVGRKFWEDSYALMVGKYYNSLCFPPFFWSSCSYFRENVCFIHVYVS